MSRIAVGTVVVGLVVVLVVGLGRLDGSRQAGPRRPGTPRATGKLAPATGALLGAFVSSTETGWSMEDVAAREALLGRSLAIDHRFQPWTADFPTPADTWDVSHGRIPMITWQPDGASLAAIAAGRADDVVRARAAAVARFGHPLFLRFAHEMNANWYPWAGVAASSPGTHDGPATYVAAWRHIHDAFVMAGATNAVWVWSPNRSSIPDESWNRAAAYYPGDPYVDWVGVDGYNRDRAPWRSFVSLVRPLVTEFGGRKPVMISETASVEGPLPSAKAAWIDGARHAIERELPAVAALVWFDAEKRGHDWRIDSSPATLAAFRALAADPYFAAP